MFPVSSDAGILKPSAGDLERDFWKRNLCFQYIHHGCVLAANLQFQKIHLILFFTEWFLKQHCIFWSNCFSLPVRWVIGIRLSSLSNFWHLVCWK